MQDEANGKPIVMVPNKLFSDNTSGNKSKKWHKFDSWSMMLCGLPKIEKAKLSNTFTFIAAQIWFQL